MVKLKKLGKIRVDVIVSTVLPKWALRTNNGPNTRITNVMKVAMRILRRDRTREQLLDADIAGRKGRKNPGILNRN